MRKLMGLWVLFVVGFVSKCVDGFEYFNLTELRFESFYGVSASDGNNPLTVGLTLIQGAAAKGAEYVWMEHYPVIISTADMIQEQTVGSFNWRVEDGVMPYDLVFTAKRLGVDHQLTWKSRYHLQEYLAIRLKKIQLYFFNWNRVKVRYCDGASFAGDSEDKAAQLEFRGQRIWSAAMEDLMSRGMSNADQALLSGCSAGGLASILHCDEFRNLFPASTKVKCLSDAGLFLDAVDVSGGHTLRNFFSGVVSLQGVQKNLPSSCTENLDPTSCFFPENLIANVKTPLFILNAAYDSWQVQASLAPASADPSGSWRDCKMNHASCSESQIQFLQDFRNHMLNAIEGFSTSEENGLFINSCFAHCQTERQDTWFADDSPLVGNKGIALSVGDWYFDRSSVKAFDCAYPCDKTCHNLIFK
ncbi:unnamed protein product [Camellia sinensis]